MRYKVALKEITCRGLRKLGQLEAMQEFIFNICNFCFSAPYGRQHDNMEKESCSKSDNYEGANGDAPEEGNMNPMIIEKVERIVEGSLDMVSSVGELKGSPTSEQSTQEHAIAVKIVVFWVSALLKQQEVKEQMQLQRHLVLSMLDFLKITFQSLSLKAIIM